MYFSTGLIFLLIVLDILVYYLQIQQEEEYASSLDQRSVHEQDHGKRKDSPSLDKQCRVFSLSEIKLATHNFDDAFVIGKGGFGKVYKGKIDQEIEVAIKRLNLESNQGATEFWAEIEMLSKFRHSHIVSLLGYCQESGQGEMILVYEYMPNGSLDDHLHKRKTNCSPLTWVQRLHICIGVARGLDYLHTGTGVQSRVIHRDIKSSNILLAENWAGKLSDFGLSRISPAYESGSTTNVYTNQLKGTFGYMDEEYYLTHRLTRKSDVYAFGVVLLEVLCGRRALDFSLDEEQHSLAIWAKDCIKEGKVDRIIDPNLRGQVEGKCLKEFGQIAYECVLNSSKDRATMTKVLARLEFVLARTLRIKQSAGDGRRTTFIDKAWSLLSTKPLKMGMSSDAMNLEQNAEDKKEGIMMEKHATTIAEGGCHDSGDNVQQVVPRRQQTTISITKIFTFSELKYATKKFSQSRVIGVGGFGTVYKGRLRSDGLAVAIKKLNPEGFQGFIEWQAEVSFLGNISHPNLVNLLGYCQAADNQRLLVYEYMEKGSLEDHLFKNGANPLSWYTRIKIAMGAAQGLAFLHTTEVICRDMKPSNILLDGDFNVKLSDFALAKLGPVNGESHVTTRIMGTYGYAAPEYIAIGHSYVWSDVYGFGVLMLEMITGLRVLDTNRDALKQNLVDWSRPMLSDKKELQRIMDPRLEQDYPTEGATKAAELILSCLEPGPRNRPSMKEVVAGLQGISAIRIKPNMSMSK